jgi:aryl-alcohol dehydrogenase-like predicted oxidoreductase
VETVADLVRQHHAALAQVARAWLLAQGSDVVAIPGTKWPRYVAENIAAIDRPVPHDDD